jgi:branched-chain amino acid transport system substrate-binding protein
MRGGRAARRPTQELIVQDKVDLLVGTSYTPNALAMSQVSTQAKVPFFIVNTSTSGILAKAPYTARFGCTQAQITDAFGRWAAKTQGQTAYLLDQDHGRGIDAGTTFGKAFTAAGGTVLGEARIPVDNRDFTAYVQRAKRPIAIDPATRDIIVNAYFMRAERRNGALGNYEFETTPMVKDPSE